MVTLAALRRHAIARSLFEVSTPEQAIGRFGFLQADPIRAPARAQDLTLRQRVPNYCAGDLEARYPELAIEEDFFVNYGFVPRALQALMHPRAARREWDVETTRRAKAVLAFVRRHGVVHPREVDDHFAHGKVTNYWGGSSNATTHLLDGMHYRGLLRIVRRDAGVRVYGLRVQNPKVRALGEIRARIDTLVDIIVGTYAPLPALSLSGLLSRLRYAVPQWTSELGAAVVRAKARLTSVTLDGVRWFYPAGEVLADAPVDERVRFLAPFDPVVWDRRRFEAFWGWPYRFEAYTPAPKRRFGYYALPILWQDQAIGWANLAMRDGTLHSEFGYVAGKAPRARAYERELDAELTRLREFLS